MELAWTKWFTICKLKFEDIPKEPRVYEVRWAINGKPQRINRLNGTDESGLLYIGVTANLQSRIKNFWRRINGGKSPHTAGHTFVAYNFERKIKLEHLEVRWAKLSNEELDKTEAALLEDYIKKFLDKPPLNLIVKRKKI